MSDVLDSSGIMKRLISEPDVWQEFYVQSPETTDRQGTRRARNQANKLRMYVKRHEYPVDVATKKQSDGLIHCWARWNERGGSSKPPTGP